MGGVAHGTWAEDDVEPSVDVVQASHSIQQPLGVAEGENKIAGLRWWRSDNPLPASLLCSAFLPAWYRNLTTRLHTPIGTPCCGARYLLLWVAYYSAASMVTHATLCRVPAPSKACPSCTANIGGHGYSR